MSRQTMHMRSGGERRDGFILAGLATAETVARGVDARSGLLDVRGFGSVRHASRGAQSQAYHRPRRVKSLALQRNHLPGTCCVRGKQPERWPPNPGRVSTREANLRGEDPDEALRRDADAVARWQRKVAPFRLGE